MKSVRTTFTAFAREVEPRLRHALVASCGTQRGMDATIDALEWAWEHWDKVGQARNPAGYLYRVARRRAVRSRPARRDSWDSSSTAFTAGATMN